MGKKIKRVIEEQIQEITNDIQYLEEDVEKLKIEIKDRKKTLDNFAITIIIKEAVVEFLKQGIKEIPKTLEECEVSDL